jgi:poly-gamma-glutamate capsule biosynthesis protein CapA/YwtB (metallophosphatase superfamily)
VTVGYSREELAARRQRRRRRRRARLRGIALLAGLFFVAGLVASWAFSGGPEDGAAKAPTTPGATTDAPAAAAPPPPPPRQGPTDETVTIAAVGDIAMGRDGGLPPGGPETLFAQVSDQLRGDVVLGNLEQALTDAGSSKCGSKGRENCFAFRTPPEYAEALEGAGFTILNLANNHSYDYGQAGMDDTVAALEGARLAHTGLVGDAPRVRKQPVRVIVLGFGFNATGESILDIPHARGVVRKAARWADVVIVTFHGGAEGKEEGHVPRGMETFFGEERGNLRTFSHAVVDAGADLVVGHGPHVLRGMEWYRDRLIAYSLGNFAGNKTFKTTGPGGVSGVLRVTLRGDGAWVKGTLVPTALVEDGMAVPDPAEAAHGVVRRLSRQDFGERAIQVSPVGELSPPSY